MAKSNEPIFWSLFSAGGMLAALFLPVLMLITGVLIPFGLVAPDALGFARLQVPLATFPLAKLVVFAIVALPFFHWAHRFKFVLVDIGLHGLTRLLGLLCYGSAIAATVATGYALWRI